MGSWHKDDAINGEYCGTTHCRAGWVVALAGKDGFQLESKTSTEFAAKLIYKNSSKIYVSPLRFYESNEKSMKDIERCANLEKLENEI